MTDVSGNRDQRILALWFPHLPADRIMRRRSGRSWRSSPLAAKPSPLMFSRRENNTQRIAALDERAEALGLKLGLGVAEARAMHPGLDIIEADEEADASLLEAIADWCDRYTPLVALDGADGLFLDVTGCAHLFGGEAALAADLLSRLTGQGFDARLGLASTPGMAWAAARCGLGMIAPGGEEEAMRSLPLAALRLDPMVRASLESVGLRRVGLVMDAPRAPLARRFGRLPLLRLDQALGRVDEPLSPRLPLPVLSAERQLAEPVSLTEDIERLIRLLAERLEHDLERREQGARALQLVLFRVDGLVQRIALDMSRPRRDPKLILRLFQERLKAIEAAIDPGCGFELVRLSVLAASRWIPFQTDFVQEGKAREDSLAVFADRVRARLGNQTLVRPVPVASHMPERAVELLPFDRAAAQKPIASLCPERPIRLFARPEPVEVTAAEVPEGPPVNFRWRRVLHHVVRAEGPERLAPEWWRAPDNASTRDYFRVEDREGRRYWLYRQGLYGNEAEMPRWFMHGLFA
ncbi:MAG: DNA polymerase Y family protein [Rhizobiaceae bacterium]|nr:DNA polymerase Y family protein [Rhizobiaceae bacterium]MCV0407546.1 DNA polymerase Y family protein [Rhizobiaceae bacterium]